MSDADQTLPLEEVMKRELSRFQSVIVEREKKEMEKLKEERDLLRKEVEEVRAKMMESHETTLLYKSTLLDLEQRASKANAAIAISPIGFSSKSLQWIILGKNTDIFQAVLKENNAKILRLEVVGSLKKPLPNNHNLIDFLVLMLGVIFPLIRCCDLKIVDRIKKNLQKENLERFEQSCFGHFLNLDRIEFQGQILLHLLMHIDVAASNNERLVLRIHNSVIEFGPTDFCLITGLRLSTFDANIGTSSSSSSPSSSSSIHNDVFNSKPRILLENIKTAFLNTSRASEGRGETTLKLAMLYFLHGTLLAVHPVQKIDLKYFGLVDDMQRFNEFPWGQVAYELFVSFLLSARRLMDSSKSRYKKPTLVIHGFSFALQVWAYETMPSLAEFCAVRASNADSITPRILKWSAVTRMIRFERLKVFFETDDKKPLMLHGMQASPAELEKLESDETIRQPKREDEALLPTEEDRSDTHVAKLLEAPRSSSAAAADNVIVISDSEEDDGIENTKRKRNEETRGAFDSTDSDDDSCSDEFMNNYVASIQSRTNAK